jgi:cytochrome c oxidase subunit 4
MTDPVAVEAPREDAELAHHPSPRTYVKVAVILAIITALEVAIYYVPSIRDFLVPSLLIFAVIKFVMVGAYFMHLKFDSPIFRRFFMVGIFLALAVFGVVLWFFFTHGGAAPALST